MNLQFEVDIVKSEISDSDSLAFPGEANDGNAMEATAATTTFLAAALLSLVSAIAAQNAQNAETFKARLSPVPISVAMMSTIAGYGSLTATLKGKQLTIQGTFEGLRSPATTVQIHRAPKGIPGPAIAES